MLIDCDTYRATYSAGSVEALLRRCQEGDPLENVPTHVGCVGDRSCEPAPGVTSFITDVGPKLL